MAKVTKPRKSKPCIHPDAFFEVLVQRTALFEEGAAFLFPKEALRYVVTVEFTGHQMAGRAPSLIPVPAKLRKARRFATLTVPNRAEAKRAIAHLHGMTLRALADLAVPLKEAWR